MTATRRNPRLLLSALCALFLLAAGCSRPKPENTSVQGEFPDLHFNLASGSQAHLTARDFRGKVVLLYFGYTHCPDVCPTTLAKLAGVVRTLGPAGAKVAILFVSVDPRRDTPQRVEQYARTFSPVATGATGSPAEIKRLAKEYGVGYSADKPDATGNYQVTHSDFVYVFDGNGHAQLLLSGSSTPQSIVHDLKEVITE